MKRVMGFIILLMVWSFASNGVTAGLHVGPQLEEQASFDADFPEARDRPQPVQTPSVERDHRQGPAPQSTFESAVRLIHTDPHIPAAPGPHPFYRHSILSHAADGAAVMLGWTFGT